MNLSKRMEALLSICQKSQVIADIGCDHGQVCVALIARGISKRVIAADISAPSLKKAETLAKNCGFEDKVDCRCGNGLQVLSPGEADGAIIAGMGGPLIIEILSRGRRVARQLRYLVLSPNTYPERLRDFLSGEGYTIVKEKMVVEQGKFYPVMLVRDGKTSPYTEQEKWIGRWEEIPDEVMEYIAYRLRIAEQIVWQVTKGGGDSSAAKRRLAMWSRMMKEARRKHE